MEGRPFTRLTSTIASYVPGASPRTPKRNVIVLIVYLLVLLLVASGIRTVTDAAMTVAFLGRVGRRNPARTGSEVDS